MDILFACHKPKAGVFIVFLRFSFRVIPLPLVVVLVGTRKLFPFMVPFGVIYYFFDCSVSIEFLRVLLESFSAAKTLRFDPFFPLFIVGFFFLFRKRLSR